MYDMYQYPEAITQRASESELRKWEASGAAVEDNEAYNQARVVTHSERVVHSDSLGVQVAAQAMVRQAVDHV